MDDLISRQDAIALAEEIETKRLRGQIELTYAPMIKGLQNLPSAQPNVHDRNVGEWDMFELITSTWYGKQCYFVEENGIVYSRVSCKHMSVDEAIKEFLWRIGDNG